MEKVVDKFESEVIALLRDLCKNPDKVVHIQDSISLVVKSTQISQDYEETKKNTTCQIIKNEQSQRYLKLTEKYEEYMNVLHQKAGQRLGIYK